MFRNRSIGFLGEIPPWRYYGSSSILKSSFGKAFKALQPQAQRLNKRSNLDVLARAEASVRDNTKIKQHRLGDVEYDDGRRSRPTDERSSKRRKLDSSAVEHEDEISEDGGSDSEGNTWHFGVGEDDEDSDIDSDEAMGESDEERFGNFKFRGSANGGAARSRGSGNVLKKTARTISLDEDDDDDEDGPLTGDEDEEDDLGEDAVDLATALDMNEEAEREEEQAKAKKMAKSLSRSDNGSEASSDSEGGSESDDEDTQSSVFSVNDGEADTGGHSKFMDFVEGLNAQNEALKGRPKSTRPSYMLENPSEFGIKPSKKLTAADLLPTVTDPRLRQSLKMLRATEKDDTNGRSEGISGKLAPPLSKRQQDRLDRGAAYDKSKETLDRWIDTVKQNRRTEHISFPLADPDAQAALGSKQLLPTTASAPMTELEATIHNIMVESGLADAHGQSGEDKLRQFEELQEKKMPIEEVQARRAELRKARDLMFREEARARRIKKIKSKAYRRVHRKERDKAAKEERAALAAAGVLDSEEEQEKLDRRRAEERMGARHRESKWAKGMKATGRAAWDEDARMGVNDLARRDEELRRRIEGRQAQNSEDEADLTSSSGSEEDYASDASNKDRSRTLQSKLDKLAPTGQATTSASRLNSLKFMQRAEEAQKAANDAEIRQLRRQLSGDPASSESSEEEEQKGGRRRYGTAGQVNTTKPSGISTVNKFEEPLSEDEQKETKRSNVNMRNSGKSTQEPAAKQKKAVSKSLPQTRHGQNQPSAILEGDDFADNPWLSGKSKSSKTKSSHDVIVSTSAPLNTTQAGQAGTLQNKQREQSSATRSRETTLPNVLDGEDLESHAATDPQSRNQELVRQAFAGDDVFEDFAREKAETMLEEGDQVVEQGLPGWGSWTGQGISKKAQRAQKRNLARFKTTIKGVQQDKRKDASLDKVIINEKTIKKNNKYLATELPHPFESRRQYESSLRQPLGPDWVTKKTFQDATKPRVLMKQGIIMPMEKPMA